MLLQGKGTWVWVMPAYAVDKNRGAHECTLEEFYSYIWWFFLYGHLFSREIWREVELFSDGYATHVPPVHRRRRATLLVLGRLSTSYPFHLPDHTRSTTRLVVTKHVHRGRTEIMENHKIAPASWRSGVQQRLLVFLFFSTWFHGSTKTKRWTSPSSYVSACSPRDLTISHIFTSLL